MSPNLETAIKFLCITLLIQFILRYDQIQRACCNTKLGISFPYNALSKPTQALNYVKDVACEKPIIYLLLQTTMTSSLSIT